MSETASAKKKMNKPLKIVLIVLASLVAFLLVFLLGIRLYFRIPVSDYYRHSEKTFVIPGLSDGMIVQGIAYREDTAEFLVTAYRLDGKPSQVSILSREGGKETKRLSLLDADGKDFLGHVGGITVNGDYVYIADEAGLIVYSYRDLQSAENGGTVTAKGVFSTKVGDDSLGVAYTHVQDGILYVGEFYRAANYPTPESHHYTTAAGDENHALILAYPLNADAAFGISPVPERAYSVRDLVQGMCLDDHGNIILSTSYGPAFSHLYLYADPKQEGEVTVLGQTVPRYVLDSSSLKRDVKAAPMSEEIIVVDGKLYTMCEAATDKYIFGKFTSAKYCHATDLSAYTD